MNNPFESFYRRLLLHRFKHSDAIYVNKSTNVNFNLSKNSLILFDLSNEKFVHLGDALFFIPLILFLSRRTCVSVLLGYSRFVFFSNILKNENVKIIRVGDDFNKKYDIVITAPYCILDKDPSVNSSLTFGLGHSDLVTDIPYPIYLSKCFTNYFGVSTNFSDIESEYEFWKSKFLCHIRFENAAQINDFKFNNQKYFIVSPFIGSGKFRDLFSFQKKKLLNAVSFFIDSGYKPILIGSINDKLIVDENWIDLRGHSLVAIASIIMDPSIKFGIGFDNFWMHYFDLINKKYIVKFRGRFIAKNRDAHNFSVNKSFSESAKWYLT